MINVAIDGPAGAGKSTIAKAAAKDLGYIYVDTGALYRTIALYMMENGGALSDSEAVGARLPEVDVRLRFLEDTQHVFLNGEDVSEKIRLPEVSMGASKVSALPVVRDFLMELQRGIARENDCIMDGRDIGTVVLPEANIKIFLTASPECRAKRRFDELKAKGVDTDYGSVLREMKERDYNDSHRAVAPLKPAADSVVVDTSSLGLLDSIQLLIEKIKEKV